VGGSLVVDGGQVARCDGLGEAGGDIGVEEERLRDDYFLEAVQALGARQRERGHVGYLLLARGGFQDLFHWERGRGGWSLWLGLGLNDLRLADDFAPGCLFARRRFGHAHGT
jgi:hypothetical protein